MKFRIDSSLREIFKYNPSQQVYEWSLTLTDTQGSGVSLKQLNFSILAKEIVTEIEKCKLMTALRMEGNTLGVDAAEVIAKALEKHPEFQVFKTKYM